MENIKVNFLVQRGQFADDDNAAQMAASVRRLKMNCVEAKYIGFGGGKEEYKSKKDFSFPENEPVVFFGTIQMYKYLFRTTKWAPLGWADFDKLKCSYYYDYFGQFLIDPDYIMLPLREILRRQDALYDSMAKNHQLFIRPDDNAKSFNGEVVAQGMLDEWLRGITINAHDANSVCVVARVKEISDEWRLIVSNGEVISGSQYRQNGLVEYIKGYENGAKKFAEHVASVVRWQPEIYCMDIAKVNGEYKLVEIGSVNCAGLYECDIEPIVKRMSELAIKEWRDLTGLESNSTSGT